MKTGPKIGIVGVGMVGGMLKKYFEKAGFKRGKNFFCFDPDPKKNCHDDTRKSDIVFICAPAPSKKDGSCDISIIEDAVRKNAVSAKAMVIKSTVPPGTTENLAKKYNCALIFSPEFLTEARAWENTINPDRQIVAPTAKAKAVALQVLHLLPPAPFTAPKHKKSQKYANISPTEAELGKYAANTFGALKVSFANVVYDLAGSVEKSAQKSGLKTKVNYENVKHILAHDKRIGDAWLNVSHGKYRGYGGFCFPKDTDALIAFYRSLIKNTSSASEKRLLKKGLALLDAMRGYNIALLAHQGLNPKTVSRHDKELAGRIGKLSAKSGSSFGGKSSKKLSK